jgi:CheY-specific phosphatase CheX
MKEIIDGVINEIWKDFFGLDVTPNTAGAPKPLDGGAVTGYVDVSGDHNLTIVVVCENAALREAAAKFYFMEPADIDQEIMMDSFRELVNLIGGNIKNLLGGGPHKLTVPTIVDSVDNPGITGKQIVHAQGFFSGGGGVQIEVYKND